MFETLVISGSALKGFASLGALQYLDENKYLDDIHTYIGTSAGAILCYLLSIGYRPVEILVSICTGTVLDKLKNFDLVKMINGQGAVDFIYLQQFLEKLTIDKIGHFITLKELKDEFNKTLTCCVYNLTKKKVEYLNFENYPNLPCITALRLSSNLPLLFDNYKYMDSYYIDGGIVDNFPIQLSKSESTIGIHIKGIETIYDLKEFKLLEYIYEILFIPINIIHKDKISKLSTANNTIVTIEFNDPTLIFNFNLSSQRKLDLFSEGYCKCKQILEEKKHSN
jgi:predicted patatin/cPLA2 family phospholipase